MKSPFLLLGAMLSPLLGPGQAITKTMLRLPDTGETISYTSTFGEDSDHTINAPYFTLNGDGTVTDTITSLMWQQSDGGEMTMEDATLYCDTLTLGGYSDWRLPNAHESFSILNHQHSNPAMDPAVFPVSEAEYWWTGTRQVNDNNKVWVTNAGGGVGNHPKTETISAGGTKRFHVRAVRDRSAPSMVPQHFVVHADGSATDLLTGLTWQRAAYPDTLSWEDALNYADTLTLAGQDDWRLPNIKELHSINNESIIEPSIENDVFGNTGSRKYWSSTTLPNQTTKAWYMFTQYGITTYDAKSRRHHVLCVRGGQDIAAGINDDPMLAGRPLVYPVPSQGDVTIEFSTTSERSAQFMVYAAEGRMVHHHAWRTLAPGRQHMVWQAEGIKPGCYLYRLVLDGDAGAVMHTGRLIIQPFAGDN